MVRNGGSDERRILLFVLFFVAVGWLGCSSEPPAPAVPEAPRHLVLISVDTLGAKHVGAYGYARDTSRAIDALAARGVLFENAYTQQVWTLTAHLSLMTGLHPQAHGASEQRAAWPAAPTLAATLKGAGFETAAFTGVGGYMSPRFGLGRGFERYAIGKTHDARDDGRRIAWLRAQAKRSAADPGHRFFLFAHYFDVHSDVGTEVPYVAPEADARRYLDEVLPPGDSWQRSGDTDLLIELEKSGEATDRDRAVLEALYHSGPLSQKEIGQKILRSSGNITMVIDNLEKTGLVRRERNEADRRFFIVHLTAKGDNLINKIFPPHAAVIAKDLGVLTAAEQNALGSLCKKLGRKGES